ncbi:hypothetical protein Y032_0341g3005 [Ancylostoma ceylanicum]|uniref:Uncharacterized protein n=1 Tax=Ancylostoma ceylanicum TaxID=53326 RepID=A0A016RYV0_9BILA|nr:hypothetical protein Y032_0341g3005 [Ancylostoma ceylanicum]
MIPDSDLNENSSLPLWYITAALSSLLPIQRLFNENASPRTHRQQSPLFASLPFVKISEWRWYVIVDDLDSRRGG